MATVKIKFRPSTVINREGTLYYQIIHERIVRQISTGYKLFPKEWDVVTSSIVFSLETDDRRSRYLSSLKLKIEADCLRLKKIIMQLGCIGKPYGVGEIVDLYNTASDNNGFISFTYQLIKQLKQIGRMRTAETYMTTLNSFIRFQGCRGDIPLEMLNSKLLAEYEVYLKVCGLCRNSISYYMRNLRAIYNRAVEKELIVQKNPFKHVYTGIEKTVKRAISIKVVRQMRNLDLTGRPSMDYARGMFMFSFYTRGMSFIDMAFLKKSDLRNGILSYRRQKTNQQLFIKWEKPMQEIVNKYDTAGTSYLLPIIKKEGLNERRQYLNEAHLINSKLKKIGKELGLSIPLTTYVARHGWASIAKNKNIPISVISEAMGHELEKTTRIYLASLDTSDVDNANLLIINSLQKE